MMYPCSPKAGSDGNLRRMKMNPLLLENDPVHSVLLTEMERTLGRLAARWRCHQQQPEAADIVRQYQAILRCMIQLGYRESLDVDSELPDEHMPTEYLTLFPQTSP
jgi:hypothetical protein